MFVALVMSSYMAYYCAYMVWESYVFEEVSYGYIPVPIWIPQLPVAIGMFALNLAVLDALIAKLRGKTPGYIKHEDDLNLEEI
ncbi:MAG: DctQ (C4-dicarboxylate permease, small subunit) [Osedax symbiont Rs2]|nr:MAG: DctQ (C4-dicarboxylate permease, small subunit) [Osedax symbiont Rs2]